MSLFKLIKNIILIIYKFDYLKFIQFYKDYCTNRIQTANVIMKLTLGTRLQIYHLTPEYMFYQQTLPGQ